MVTKISVLNVSSESLALRKCLPIKIFVELCLFKFYVIQKKPITIYDGETES